MRFHGNYCGPNWSAGKHQASVVDDTVEAIDMFDEACLRHDAAYANDGDLDAADAEFIKTVSAMSLDGAIAATAVSAQRLSRLMFNMTKPNNNKQNLRGSKPNTKPMKANTKSKNVMAMTSAPAASGVLLSNFAPVVTRSNGVVKLAGREYGATVSVVNTTTFIAAAAIPLSPAYFQSALLGTHAKCHELYRFRKVTVHYVPAVPTSSQGQILILSNTSIFEPFLNGASSSFLARGMTQSNAALGPIWQKFTTPITVDNEWRKVDLFSDADADDNILAEVQVYGWSDATLTAGSIIIDYEIEFKEPVYQPHQTAIPDSLGPGAVITLIDNSPANAIGDTFALTNATINAYTSGYIFRFVFRQAASTLPTGVGSWGMLNKVNISRQTTISTTTQTQNAITMAEGTTLYGVVGDSVSIYLYADLPSALACGSAGLVAYQTATTAAGSYSFIVQLIHASPTIKLTVQ